MSAKEVQAVELQVEVLQERLASLEKQRPVLATENTQLHAALLRRTQCLADRSSPAIVDQACMRAGWCVPNILWATIVYRMRRSASQTNENMSPGVPTL